MTPTIRPHYTAFDGERLLANGDLDAVTRAARDASKAGAVGPMLVFDDQSGQLVDVDLRPASTPRGNTRGATGMPESSGAAEGKGTSLRRMSRLDRLAPALPRGPGRPKLGVVAREVTLLPRHWDWLATQPSGASATLRRLVEEARRTGHGQARQRQAEEAVDRFMQAMTGNYVGHEEASRAFWRNERENFETLIAAWPKDVREYLRQLAAVAWTLRVAASEAAATPATHEPRR